MTDIENAQQPGMVCTDFPAGKLFVPYHSVIYPIASIKSPFALPKSVMLHYYCILFFSL